MRHALALLLLCVAAPAAAQTDCTADGLNPAERMVCSDPVLASRDATLAQLLASQGTEGLDPPQPEWRARRDACGSDIFCIERLYDARIGQLSAPLPAPRTDLRPWCDAGLLNPTERAICEDETLADLDAALSAVYGAAVARDDDDAQQDWLRGERDTCGPARDCIAGAYLRRISELGRVLRTP